MTTPAILPPTGSPSSCLIAAINGLTVGAEAGVGVGVGSTILPWNKRFYILSFVLQIFN